MGKVEDVIRKVYNTNDYPVAILIDRDGGIQVFGRRKVVALKMCPNQGSASCLLNSGQQGFINFFASLVDEKIEAKQEAMG